VHLKKYKIEILEAIMTISQIIFLLDATPLSATVDMEHTIETVCGSDMMSDVLAFIKKDALLLTGLNNLQVIRTAEMLDIVCLVFVRGKIPQKEMLRKAEELGITVLTTEHTMFDACGILYHAGLRGGSRHDA